MKNIEKKNYNKKSGAKAVIITLIVIFLLVAGGLVTLIFGFPKTMGDICYSMGFNSFASKLYNTSYEKDKDINMLYFSLNCAIKAQNYGLIIKQFEKLHNTSDYSNFIAFIDEENEKIDDYPLIKAAMLNEDNYLKNQYIIALIAKEKVDDAFAFALADGLEINVSYNNLGNFLYGNFLGQSEEFLQRNFFTQLDGRDNSLDVEITAYFNRIYTEFRAQYNSVADEYVIAMGNRLVYVGETLKGMCNKVGVEFSEELTNIMIEVNANIADKLMS